jgi:tRNA/rRNA methyltransferase
MFSATHIPITRFILLHTHHKGNVGAAARAIKTMGFDDLVLVSPRDEQVLNRRETKEAASGANDVLEKIRIYDNMEEALEGTTHWCATAMPNDMSLARPKHWKFEAPREHFRKLLTKNTQDIRIAFLFGNERVGMRKEHVEKCHAVLGIPTNPVSGYKHHVFVTKSIPSHTLAKQFGSLNLASAVQLIAYDWREAIGGFKVS